MTTPINTEVARTIKSLKGTNFWVNYAGGGNDDEVEYFLATIKTECQTINELPYVVISFVPTNQKEAATTENIPYKENADANGFMYRFEKDFTATYNAAKHHLATSTSTIIQWENNTVLEIAIKCISPKFDKAVEVFFFSDNRSANYSLPTFHMDTKSAQESNHNVQSGRRVVRQPGNNGVFEIEPPPPIVPTTTTPPAPAPAPAPAPPPIQQVQQQMNQSPTPAPDLLLLYGDATEYHKTGRLCGEDDEGTKNLRKTYTKQLWFIHNLEARAMKRKEFFRAMNLVIEQNRQKQEQETATLRAAQLAAQGVPCGCEVLGCDKKLWPPGTPLAVEHYCFKCKQRVCNTCSWEQEEGDELACFCCFPVGNGCPSHCFSVITNVARLQYYTVYLEECNSRKQLAAKELEDREQQVQVAVVVAGRGDRKMVLPVRAPVNTWNELGHEAEDDSLDGDIVYPSGVNAIKGKECRKLTSTQATTYHIHGPVNDANYCILCVELNERTIALHAKANTNVPTKSLRRSSYSFKQSDNVKKHMESQEDKAHYRLFRKFVKKYIHAEEEKNRKQASKKNKTNTISSMFSGIAGGGRNAERKRKRKAASANSKGFSVQQRDVANLKYAVMTSDLGLPLSVGEHDTFNDWHQSSVGINLNGLGVNERNEEIRQNIIPAPASSTNRKFMRIVAQTTKTSIARRTIQGCMEYRLPVFVVAFDLYKNQQGNNENGVLGQYFNLSTQELECDYLGLIPITTAHTGENIKKTVEDVLRSYKYVVTEEEWNASPFGSSRELPTNMTLTLLDFVHAATTDNAGNVKRAVSLMGLKGVGCGGHKINLVAKMSLGGKFPRSGHPDYMKDPYSD